jgi:hypothetical protein
MMQEKMRKEAEEAARRVAAAEVRNQKMDKARAAVLDTVRGMTNSAAGIAKTGFTGARDRLDGWRKRSETQ